jgi:hypothetical protein
VFTSELGGPLDRGPAHGHAEASPACRGPAFDPRARAAPHCRHDDAGPGHAPQGGAGDAQSQHGDDHP